MHCMHEENWKYTVGETIYNRRVYYNLKLTGIKTETKIGGCCEHIYTFESDILTSLYTHWASWCYILYHHRVIMHILKHLDWTSCTLSPLYFHSCCHICITAGHSHALFKPTMPWTDDSFCMLYILAWSSFPIVPVQHLPTHVSSCGCIFF